MHAAVDAMLAAAKDGDATDPATRAAAAMRLKDGAALAAELGDREELGEVLTRLQALTAGDAFVAELGRKKLGRGR
jgi:hypothetical protein